MKCLNLVAGVMSAILVSAPAFAGEFSTKVGIFSSFSSDYEGSDDYEAGAFPFLSFGWQADPVIPAGGTGLQLGLHDITFSLPGTLDMGLAKLYRPEGTYRANLGFAYNMGRDQDDNSALSGMGDIDGHALATLGMSFKSKSSGWSYGVSYTGDISDETDGATIDGKLGYAYPINKQLISSVSSSLSWANQDHMQSYFGVSSAQASRSSNTKFDADSGLKSADLGVGLTWLITENWAANSRVNYTRLLNDAADSRLVDVEGSADQFSVAIGLIYTF